MSASEFTDVLQGVLADVLTDYGPALEKRLGTAHTRAQPGEVAAEVLALAVSFVAQVCSLTFRQEGSEVGAALDLWMDKLCERLPSDSWLPARASEYSGFIMEDLRSLDECLAGRVPGIFPFKHTIALFLGRHFESDHSRLPTLGEAEEWKQFGFDLVRAAGFLTDGFRRLVADIDVENFIPGVQPGAAPAPSVGGDEPTSCSDFGAFLGAAMFDVGQGQVRRDLAKLVGSLKEVLYLTMFFAEQAVAQTVEREKSGRVIVAFHSAFATAAVKAESAQGWAEMDERARYFRWKAFHQEASARCRQYLALYEEDMRRIAQAPAIHVIPFRRIGEELLRVGGLDAQHQMPARDEQDQMLAPIEVPVLVTLLYGSVLEGVGNLLRGVRLM